MPISFLVNGIFIPEKKKTFNIEFWVVLHMLSKFEIIWMRTGQVIRLQNDINISETPSIVKSKWMILSIIYHQSLQNWKSVIKNEMAKRLNPKTKLYKYIWGRLIFLTVTYTVQTLDTVKKTYQEIGTDDERVKELYAISVTW